MKKQLRVFSLIILDAMLAFASAIFAVWLTNEDVAKILQGNWFYFVGGCVALVVAQHMLNCYVGMWKYAGFSDALKLIASVLIFGVYNVIVALISITLGIEWVLMNTLSAMVFVLSSRFLVRARWLMETMSKKKAFGNRRVKVMIVGAGSAGNALVREMKTGTKFDMYPVCFLDDDDKKIGRTIDGIRVVGKIKDASYFAKKFDIDKIIIAIPSASGEEIESIMDKCRRSSCKVMTVSGAYELESAKSNGQFIKEIDIQDLLGREPVKVNLDEIMGYIEGKTILVTGGGGSIGSELCRQIATHNPRQLIVLDIYENNAYEIQQELLRRIPNLNLTVLIASVRDSKKVNDVFEKYRPDIVFHAAAHKHVPLMETSPNEAVKNNVSGTLKVAEAAGKNGVEKFVLISTDKAVNPTNIMGATKRICEMIIQTMNKKYHTEYVAVRFGNVLGSNGSVIPLFKRQIEEGGPVTVTHKDIVRYFMTIPEAVSLVLQAGAYARGGEIFVLNMGDPVKIYDLAVKMIKLSGFEPFEDIDIKITGLRPGEKLYEERLMEEEGLKETNNKMISIGKPLEIDEENLYQTIEQLYVEAYNETDKMKELVHKLVPTYRIDKRKR